MSATSEQPAADERDAIAAHAADLQNLFAGQP
jgi:hypothetical protein